MTSAEDVDIRVRLRGGKIAAAEANAVAVGVDHIGRAAGRSSRQLGFLSAAGAGARRTLSDVGGAARWGATWVGRLSAVAGTYGAYTGLKFNATLEQNRIAFTQFLGGAEAADRQLEHLWGLAKETPFEFTDVTLATRKFLAFGFSLRETNDWLRTVADTASGAALDQGAIDRMVLVLGQIRSTGELQGDELRQLTELGVFDREKFRKELKLSREEMANIADQDVPAGRVLRALKKQWDETFGGQSAKQAKTFNGQLSTMRDNFKQMMGALTEGGFEELRDDVFPAINRAAERISATFRRTDIDTETKLRRARKIVRQELGPLADDVVAALEEAELGEKFAGFVEAAAPRIADAAADAAPRAAEAFVRAWLNMGPWGKLLTTSLIAKRLGVFTVLGRRAAGRFGAAWGTSVGPVLDRQKARMRPGLQGFGKWMGRAIGIAAVGAIALSLRDWIKDEVPALGQYSGKEGWGELWRDLEDWLPGEDSEARRRRERREREEAERNNPLQGLPDLRPLDELDGRRRRPGARRRGSSARGASAGASVGPTQIASVPPLQPVRRFVGVERPPLEVTLHAPVYLDGRQVAEAVARHVDRRANRR
jgi:hypothetical protein